MENGIRQAVRDGPHLFLAGYQVVALIWGCFYKRGEKVLLRNYFVDDEKRNKGSVCLFKMKMK